MLALRPERQPLYRFGRGLSKLVHIHIFAGLQCRTELFSYEQCIFYTVVSSIVSLERMDLKSKVPPPPPPPGPSPLLPPLRFLQPTHSLLCLHHLLWQKPGRSMQGR